MGVIHIELGTIVRTNHGEPDTTFGSDDSLLYHLDEIVEVGKDVTLDRVMRAYITDINKDVFNLILLSAAGNIPNCLDKFERILNIPVHSEDMMDGMISVRVHRAYDILNTGRTQYWGSRWEFSGYGLVDDYTAPNSGKQVESLIAVEFSPINLISHLPVDIQTKWDLISYSNDPIKKEIVAKIESEITVYELITAIVYEMTFDGIIDPVVGSKRLWDLRKTIDAIDSGEDVGKVIDFDELMNMLGDENDEDDEDDDE